MRLFALFVLLCFRFLVNCYTLAWVERLRHGRGQVALMAGFRGGHYGLHLELVTVHYVPSMRSWWGWKRRIEVGGSISLHKGRA